MTMDTRGLERAIVEVVPETRRTVAEQCVTSMGMILQDAQNWTTYVDIGRMDAELDAIDHVSKPRSDFAKENNLGGLPWTEGMMIAVQRTNPNSPFNLQTGGRWAIPYTGGLKGIQRWGFFRQIAERMQAARHSSGHFIQAGFKAAIQFCVTSPLFKNRYRAKAIYANPNSLNTLDGGKLGDARKTPADVANFSITAENNVGDRAGLGNAVLDAKHRQALIDFASGPLNDAIEKEREVQVGELARRLDLKYAKFNKMLA